MHIPGYNCEFCIHNVEKGLLQCYFTVLLQWPVDIAPNIITPSTDDIFVILECLKGQIHLSFFMEVIVSMSWAIIIFRNVAHLVSRCKTIFKQEFALVMQRAKASYHPYIDQWLQAFV